MAAPFYLGLARRIERVHVGSHTRHAYYYSRYVGCYSIF